MGINLAGLKAAVIGGDERETETLRLLKQSEASIDAFGLPASAEQVLQRPQAKSLQEAVAGSHIILCPIPLPEADGRIYAPHSSEKIYLSPEFLSGASPSAVIITGVATAGMRDSANRYGFHLHEYEHDDDLMILRSASIAEGAVSTAIQNSLVSIHQSQALITGFGRIGTALGHLLMGMRARLHTVTPLAIEQAHAYEVGLTVYTLEQLPEIIGRMEIIFNTIPVRLYDRRLLSQISRDALLIDIVAPPGGVDREAAQELGVHFIWARGLGRFGPRTVAKSQWIGVERILGKTYPDRLLEVKV